MYSCTAILNKSDFLEPLSSETKWIFRLFPLFYVCFTNIRRLAGRIIKSFPFIFYPEFVIETAMFSSNHFTSFKWIVSNYFCNMGTIGFKISFSRDSKFRLLPDKTANRLIYMDDDDGTLMHRKLFNYNWSQSILVVVLLQCAILQVFYGFWSSQEFEKWQGLLEQMTKLML